MQKRFSAQIIENYLKMVVNEKNGKIPLPGL